MCLVLLTALALAATTANAQTNSTSTNAPAAKPKMKSTRYAGTIASVDAAAKTITVTLASGATETLSITSKTKIKKDGEPATLADAAAGQKVKGSSHKNDAGDWVATTVNIGETKKAAPPAQ